MSFSVGDAEARIIDEVSVTDSLFSVEIVVVEEGATSWVVALSSADVGGAVFVVADSCDDGPESTPDDEDSTAGSTKSIEIVQVHSSH